MHTDLKKLEGTLHTRYITLACKGVSSTRIKPWENEVTHMNDDMQKREQTYKC